MQFQIQYGILLASKYQIIYIDPLGGEDRKRAINFLFSRNDQITIHPIININYTKSKLNDEIFLNHFLISYNIISIINRDCSSFK